MYTFFLSCVSAVICAYLTRHFFDFRSAHLKRACACRTAAALTCKPPFFIVLIVVSLFCYYITLTAVCKPASSILAWLSVFGVYICFVFGS